MILENQKIRERQEKVFKTPLHLIILSSQDLQDVEDRFLFPIWQLASIELNLGFEIIFGTKTIDKMY